MRYLEFENPLYSMPQRGYSKTSCPEKTGKARGETKYEIERAIATYYKEQKAEQEAKACPR